MQQKDYNKNQSSCIPLQDSTSKDETSRRREAKTGGSRHHFPEKAPAACQFFSAGDECSPLHFLCPWTFAIVSVHPDVLQHRSRAIQGGRARC